jgi:hypothetical protein
VPRLAICHRCRTLQRFPDVPHGTPKVPARLQWTDGADYMYRDDKGLPVMVPAYDPMLEDFVERHNHGMEDQVFVEGVIQVYEIDQKTWDSVDVVQKIRNELHESTEQWYGDRDTYREGAIACYNEHDNPTTETGCRDFMDDSKRIGVTHYRDDDGKQHTIPRRHQQYICHLCPYMHSYVQVEIRRKKGLYNLKRPAPAKR